MIAYPPLQSGKAEFGWIELGAVRRDEVQVDSLSVRCFFNGRETQFCASLRCVMYPSIVEHKVFVFVLSG